MLPLFGHVLQVRHDATGVIGIMSVGTGLTLIDRHGVSQKVRKGSGLFGTTKVQINVDSCTVNRQGLKQNPLIGLLFGKERHQTKTLWNIL